MGKRSSQKWSRNNGNKLLSFRQSTARHVKSQWGAGAIAGMVLGAIGLGGLAGWGMTFFPVSAEPLVRQFSFCHTGGGTNCVVDGDTIWLDGAKIRIADIDAPETHPPRCGHEADLGGRATNRLQQLLNSGPVTVTISGGRDEDKYGRKLRIIKRDGQSVGDILVSEGLARPWEGHRRPWCD